MRSNLSRLHRRSDQQRNVARNARGCALRTPAFAPAKMSAGRVVERLGCDPIYRDYIGVLINNEMWRETLAAVPYERRLLLLPKCLRVESLNDLDAIQFIAITSAF